MAQYEANAGVTGNAVTAWPAGATLAGPAGKPLLLFFIHPKCPCTSASANELERALAHCGAAVDTKVVVYRPADSPPGWADTSLVRGTTTWPNAMVVDDVDGALGKRFDAHVSGEVVLYGADGRLLYQGGATGARGHEGDNEARAALEARIKDQTLPPCKMPVFGCAIRS